MPKLPKSKERKSRHHKFYAAQKETAKTIDLSVFNRLENNINLLMQLLK